MHVRRGDKIIGMSAEAKAKTAEEYCKGLEKLVGDDNITEPVFIAAESMSSIEDIKKARENWEIWYIDIPRYANLRQGNFSHHDFLKSWTIEDRVYFYKMFLAEITMMRFAHSFVGTGSSNVWQLIRILRNLERILSLDK